MQNWVKLRLASISLQFGRNITPGLSGWRFRPISSSELAPKAADISIHPLFESLGLPELPESIVRELYTAEVSHLSKKITEPLADSLFRPGSVQANNAVSELTEIANRPALDVAVLPTRLVEPTMGDRAPGQVREADELARKLVDPNYELKEIPRKAVREAIEGR